MTANHAMYLIDKIQDRYNAEHDLPPINTPLVTWTDNALLEISLALIERCDKLERRVAELERVAGLDNKNPKGF